MSGTASAGTNQVGTIGDKDATPPQLVDLHSEDINNADTITTDTLNAERLQNTFYRVDDSAVTHFYESLTDMKAEISDSDYVFIPSGTYEPITISNQNVFVQCGGMDTRFNASNGDAVTITANKVTMQNFQVDASGVNDDHGVVVDAPQAVLTTLQLNTTGTPAGNHIRVTSNGSFASLSIMMRQASAGGDSIFLENGADACIIDEYRNAGPIQDNGSGNVIGLTT
jgi:hypothetical protein